MIFFKNFHQKDGKNGLTKHQFFEIAKWYFCINSKFHIELFSFQVNLMFQLLNRLMTHILGPWEKKTSTKFDPESIYLITKVCNADSAYKVKRIAFIFFKIFACDSLYRWKIAVYSWIFSWVLCNVRPELWLQRIDLCQRNLFCKICQS